MPCMSFCLSITLPLSANVGRNVIAVARVKTTIIWMYYNSTHWPAICAFIFLWLSVLCFLFFPFYFPLVLVPPSLCGNFLPQPLQPSHFHLVSVMILGGCLFFPHIFLLLFLVADLRDSRATLMCYWFHRKTLVPKTSAWDLSL